MSILEERIESGYYKSKSKYCQKPQYPTLSSTRPSVEEAKIYLDELDIYNRKISDYSDQYLNHRRQQSILSTEFFKEMLNQYFSDELLHKFDSIIHKAYEMSRIYDDNNELDFEKTHCQFRTVIPIVYTAIDFFTKK